MQDSKGHSRCPEEPGQVRTQKECKPVRGTHSLESPDRESGQDMERMRVTSSKGTHILMSQDRETSQDSENGKNASK